MTPLATPHLPPQFEPMTRRSVSSGFANTEYLIAVAVLLVIASIVIPAAYRSWRRVKDAALIADVRRVAAAEDAYRAAHKVWADTLVVKVSLGAHLDQFRTDSTGWSVVVVGDSGRAKGRHCGMFDGADLFRPSGEVGPPRELACW
jgi:type II secretory pathway pseudopilin PulG